LGKKGRLTILFMHDLNKSKSFLRLTLRLQELTPQPVHANGSSLLEQLGN
jgi:hypothetical protein